MRRIALFVAVLTLAACGPTMQERAEALQALVGQPEATVVQQFGVPDRVYEAGGIKFLAYEQRRLGFAPGIYGAAPYGPLGGPLGGPFGGGPFGGGPFGGGPFGGGPFGGGPFGGGPFAGPYGGYAYGYAAFPPLQVVRICETTFEVAGGIIRRATQRGACGG